MPDTKTLSNLIFTYGVNIAFALVILVLGWVFAKILKKTCVRFALKIKLEQTLAGFFGNSIYIIVVIIAILAALGRLGVQTTSLIAILGAAGLAIGLAFKDSLSNFAAGIMIITYRPFKIGDYIDIGGSSGTVDELNVFFTTLKTPDNQVVYVPNNRFTTSDLINYSEQPVRRINLVIGVSYGDDLRKVRETLLELVKQDERLLPRPEPLVLVTQLADSSVNVAVRAWARTEDYWAAYFDLVENAKLRFDEVGISIPYPQTDAHIDFADKSVPNLLEGKQS